MTTFTKQMRGIPLWLLREYLEEIGGKAQGEARIVGVGWIANLTQLEDFSVGSLTVGQVLLEVQAEEDTWELLQPVLEKKLLRAGG